MPERLQLNPESAHSSEAAHAAMLHDPGKINAQEEPKKLPVVPVLQTNELVNAVTHGIGLVLSIVGAIVLIARSHSQGDAYPLFHGVWHMFVIAGSTCHFLTTFFFVGNSP